MASALAVHCGEKSAQPVHEQKSGTHLIDDNMPDALCWHEAAGGATQAAPGGQHHTKALH